MDFRRPSWDFKLRLASLRWSACSSTGSHSLREVLLECAGAPVRPSNVVASPFSEPGFDDWMGIQHDYINYVNLCYIRNPGLAVLGMIGIHELGVLLKTHRSCPLSPSRKPALRPIMKPMAGKLESHWHKWNMYEYPLVNIYIANWRVTILKFGKSTVIFALLVYRRLCSIAIALTKEQETHCQCSLMWTVFPE